MKSVASILSIKESELIIGASLSPIELSMLHLLIISKSSSSEFEYVFEFPALSSIINLFIRYVPDAALGSSSIWNKALLVSIEAV